MQYYLFILVSLYGLDEVKKNCQHSNILFQFQVFQSTCSVDISYFPFDTQRCSLEFVAWSYKIQNVKFETYSGIVLATFSKSSTWELADSFTNVNNTRVPMITFTLILNRKPLFYVLNIIVPVIFLSVMNLFTFTLPVKSGERASYAVTLFLAVSVFLTIIASEFPKNSDNLSYIAMYLTIMTSISTLIVIITVLQLRLINREDKYIYPGKCYIFLHKAANRIRCKSCKRHSPKVSDTQEEEEEGKSEMVTESNEQNGTVTWSDVNDAMDFLCFLIGNIVISTVTLAMFLILLNNPHRR